jgi:putative resolvase
MWSTAGRLAKQEGVTKATILNWIKKGYYEKTKQTKGGHHRIWVENEPITLLYGRVSSKKQESSLESQKTLLQQEFKNAKFISDVGSGFNFKRKNFVSILERAIDGTPFLLVATNQDRITRTGFKLIERIIELVGGRIHLLEETNKQEDFNIKDFVGFITSFINSYYGKRSHHRKKASDNIKENKGLSKEQKVV